jgi:hypothetical protein
MNRMKKHETPRSGSRRNNKSKLKPAKIRQIKKATKRLIKALKNL